VSSITLPYLSAARVSGPDADAFLHGQLSADISGLQEGQATFACYCSPRGQVFGLLLVIRTAGDNVVVGAANLLPAMLERLQLYVLRSRVKIAPAPGLAVVGLTDPKGGGAAGFSPPEVGLTYGLQKIDARSAAPAEEWKVLELARGVAWLGPETAERFIPQMLGFEEIGAVSFSKGCYPGQEIIARAKHRGKVKRRPQRLLAESGPIAAGSSVRLSAGGQSIAGTVVDSVAAGTAEESSGNRHLIMAVSAEPSGPVETLEHEGRSYPCATM
jgi:folate-binding protein YgfZ